MLVYCCRCKKKYSAESMNDLKVIQSRNNKSPRLTGTCRKCGCGMSRFCKDSDISNQEGSGLFDILGKVYTPALPLLAAFGKI